MAHGQHGNTQIMVASSFVPALCLAVYLIGGTAVLVGVALALPLICAIYLLWPRRDDTKLTDMSDILKQREDLELRLDQTCLDYVASGHNAACFIIEIEGFDQLKARYGLKLGHFVFQTATNRVAHALRSTDMVARISSSGLGVCAKLKRRFESESPLQIAQRLVATLEKPIVSNGQTFDLTVSIGLCITSRAPAQDGRSILAAATHAQQEAAQKQSGKIHAYSERMGGLISRPDLGGVAADALTQGQITPWFQPQFDTQTGALLGVEALARWIHPDHGMIPPLQFLDVMRDCGLWHKMTDHILDQSLQAIKTLENAGISIPHVGVNFAQDDLAQPDFIDRVKWALDKHGLSPSRLCVEILETVVANTHGQGNVNVVDALMTMGCKIDLDDFGTGHASIASLKNFRLNRIKIDRSFVSNIDKNAEQQKMMQTIVLMAKQLGFETLAEGIENDAELDVLKNLGCDAVQGYGLGKPMPFGELRPWLVSSGHATPGAQPKPTGKAA